MSKTVKMFKPNPKPGQPRTADVHPNEVENMKAYGWQLGEDPEHGLTAEEKAAPTGQGNAEPEGGQQDGPSMDWTVAKLRAYAKDHSIAMPASATSKEAILAVIEQAQAGQNSAPSV